MSENTQQPKSMEEFEQQYQEEIRQSAENEVDQVEDMSYNYEPLEQGADITHADVELWKKQFPYSKVYTLTIIDERFVVRTLNRVEYKMIVSREDLNAMTREETIFKTCCLYPKVDSSTIGQGGAGIPASVAKFIMEASGFMEPEEVQRLA